MPFTVAAIGAGVSAAAGIAGGIMQKNAVDKGASQARDALNQGVTTATNQLSPWATTGQPANADQADLLGLNGQPAADAAMAKFQQSPGYQWQLSQGERAVNASAAANEMARSGATMKALDTFGQSLANTDFGNYWNRLQQLSGSGLDAAKGIASAATGGAQQIAQTDTGQASMDASIYGNMAKSIGTSANQLLQTNAVQNYLGGAGGGGGASSYAQMPGADLGVGLMSGFFNANVTSPFPDANMLFDPAKAQQTAQAIQHNQLGLQAQQLDLTAADHEQVGRLAAGLLNIKDPAARAQGYAQGVGVLQSQGLAKYAPPTVPDEQSLQMLVSQTIPVQDQYKMGIISPPGLTDALARASAPPPGYGGTGATGTGTTGSGDFGTRLAQSESGGKTSVINQQGYTGTYQFGKQRLADLGYYTPAPGENMKDNTTWAGKVSVPGFNVTDQQSFAANPAAQQAVFNTHLGNIDQAIAATPGASRFDPNGLRAVAHLGGIEGMQKFVASGGVFSPSDANGTSLAAYYNKFSGGTPGGATTASAAPTTAQPGQPVPTQVASNTPMVSTAPAAPTAAPGAPAQPAVPSAATAQPGQPQPAAAPAAAAQPGATPLPGTGVNSQQFQTALWKTQQAAQLETQFPNSPAAKAKAAELRAEAALYMQADSVITLPNGIQVKALSGQQVDAAKPLPHYVYDAGQHAYIDTTGTNKPEFEPAQRDSAVAQRDVMELGPKVANGTATQAEQARYATAVETYRQPVLRENPVSKETMRVNTRELPAGFPEPPSLGGGGGALGGAGTAGGANVVIPGLSPQQQQIERNKGRYDIAVEDLKHDRGEINAISDAGRGAQQDNLRVKEMQDILQHADTGPGTENAAKFRAWIARWMPGDLSRWDGSGANLSNPAAIEMFQKLGFVGAVTQERGSTPRGGYQATKMFQQFNPGAQLLTSSNQGLLAQRMIANQAEADYAQGAQDHYNTQRERLKSPEQDYEPLSSFDAKWQAQKNPQVYAAAIGALGGQDPEMWARGLSKDEIQRVKDVVSRADPNAVIHMPGEGKVVLQPNAKPLPPGFKVQ